MAERTSASSRSRRRTSNHVYEYEIPHEDSTLQEATIASAPTKSSRSRASAGSTADTAGSSTRVTRSTSRLAASADQQASPSTSNSPPPSRPTTTPSAAPSKKRKAPPTPPASHPTANASTGKRGSKRQRGPDPAGPSPSIPQAPGATQRRRAGTMPGNGAAAGPSTPRDNPGHSSAHRKASRSKKLVSDVTPSASTSGRRSKRQSNDGDGDVTMGNASEDEKLKVPPPPPPEHGAQSSDSDEEQAGNGRPEDHDDEDDYAFGRFGAFAGHGRNLQSTLAAFSGMMQGTSQRLRGILEQLRQKEDQTVQLIALNELSELLLISNEDNLSPHFQPDTYAKELIGLMKPDPFTEVNPEIMLLACRCLANMMEALPSSVSAVVYSGAVPVLCAKLRDIEFIDLAEQALSTLEKVSVEYPGSIVKEGGLAACLEYLDFFATSTQRTAVTTAANCCRHLSADTFDVVRDAMRILRDVLKSSDQRVVEQASLCVSRIVEAFRYNPTKLEALVSADLLSSILRLLLPGTTNLVSPSIHTQFLRVLAATAKASPTLSAELFKMNVVETVYQILTGVSPPNGADDVASKLDSVLIMQALIHRPREQIIETLNVICELLPKVSDLPTSLATNLATDIVLANVASDSESRSINQKRTELLEGCRPQVRRFALILFPTLTDAFSSTVNLTVRQKVLLAQLKMLSTLDPDILEEALGPVPYASFLAGILSQKDHPSLVEAALDATRYLMVRVGKIYRYQLYREGVIAEIKKLAEHVPVEPAAAAVDANGSARRASAAGTSTDADEPAEHDENDEDGEGDYDDKSHHSSEGDDDDDDPDEDGEGDDDDDEDVDEEEIHQVHIDDGSASPASSRASTVSIDGPATLRQAAPSIQARIHQLAKTFMAAHEIGTDNESMKSKADEILADISTLSEQIKAYYFDPQALASSTGHGQQLFAKLAKYFGSDVFDGITSAELLASGLVTALEEVFHNPDEKLALSAQASFLEVFLGQTVKSAQSDHADTAFSVTVHKLQDLLSRSEHFEVITVSSPSYNDSHRNSATSALAKQIRLRLVGQGTTGLPSNYSNIMVSIHAISTFKSLADYLGPRISLADRPPRLPKPKDAPPVRRTTGGSGESLFGGPSTSVPSSKPAPRPASGQADSTAAPSTPTPTPTPTPGSGAPSRTLQKTKTRRAQPADAPSTPAATGASQRAASRSKRRQNDTPTQPPPPPVGDDDLENALECADERHIADEGDEVEALREEASALAALVGDLDEGLMGTPPDNDPSAVNVEVASESGKVIARREDGTRVPTPSQTTSGPPPPPTLTQRMEAMRSLFGDSPLGASAASRLASYSAALRSTKQDWHLVFYYQGKPLDDNTTIFRAISKATESSAQDPSSSRNIWSTVHEISYKKVSGPAPPATLSVAQRPTEQVGADPNAVPASLTEHPTTASILALLKTLHGLNANIDNVLEENKAAVSMLNKEPLSQFVNTKLTAKLNRQLEEPLIVASNCLPGWSEDLARLYPFLFPFETRHLFLQSTSFGYARSMTRWQSNTSQDDNNSRRRQDERAALGRLLRQKVRISRSKVLESALKVMDLYGTSQSILEVEYFEEVGTGLGPTLEFYSTASREFSKHKLRLWRDDDTVSTSHHNNHSQGLFPRPMSDEDAQSANGERVLSMFKTMGKFVARSMIDSRIIDINFNPMFFRVGTEVTGIKASVRAVKAVDAGLGRSLMAVSRFAEAKQQISQDPQRDAARKVHDIGNIKIDGHSLEDLSLDFTLPGYPEVELVSNGALTDITIDNVEEYLEKVVDATLGNGVRRQLEAFRAGFSQVFPYTALSAFTPDELVMLFGRVEEDWTLATLMDSMKADHGYNMDSRSIRNLLQVMSELNAQQRRDFLQFTTGSPKLPIGGFKSLTPMFTVVCKPAEAPYSSDDYLPSVMTCVNYLKLPDYSDYDIMKKRILTAIREGQGAFHLS